MFWGESAAINLELLAAGVVALATGKYNKQSLLIKTIFTFWALSQLITCYLMMIMIIINCQSGLVFMITSCFGFFYCYSTSEHFVPHAEAVLQKGCRPPPPPPPPQHLHHLHQHLSDDSLYQPHISSKNSSFLWLFWNCFSWPNPLQSKSHNNMIFRIRWNMKRNFLRGWEGRRREELRWIFIKEKLALVLLAWLDSDSAKGFTFPELLNVLKLFSFHQQKSKRPTIVNHLGQTLQHPQHGRPQLCQQQQHGQHQQWQQQGLQPSDHAIPTASKWKGHQRIRNFEE